MGLLSLAGSSVAQATTRTVTTTANSGTGSLRATIASSAPGDTVVVPASAQHYQVTSGEIPITVAPLTIQGAGAGSSVIDASGGSSRVFHVSASPASSQTITFSGVTITGGKATAMPGGGGILVDSVSPTVALNLALMGTTVSGNHATVSTGASTCCGGGGGIYSNGGSVTLNSSSVSSNTATVTGTGSGTGTTCCGGGGGIYDNTSVNGSAVTLTGSSVNNNIATVTDNDGVHGGGGIHVEGAHSTVIDIVVAGASQVSNNNFTANGGTEDASNCCSGGGAIYQDSSTTTISDSRLSGNTATVNSGACCHGGGAVFDDAGGGTITRSNVSSNTSTVNGPAGGTGNSHCCLGGGALNTVGGWTLTSSTMDSNTSSVSAGECCHGGGAVQQDSDTHPLHVNGSTISRNSAEFNQAAGPTSSGGGAVYEDQGTANNTYTNSTISNNSTNVSGLVAQGGGGIYVFANTTNTDQLANVTMARNSAQTALGGGIYNLRSKVDSRNSIVALNTAGLDANCYGTSSPVITSLGYNLEDSANTCGFSATGDKVVPAAAVGLGPLANNGGPTQTQALLSGSAAVDAGNPAGCTSPSGAPLTTDQRGFPRPSGPRCDIGAYELQANNPLPSAAKCTLKSKSNKVLVRKPKKGKHKKAKVGVLTLKIRCNQGASLKLTGKVVEQLRKKKGKHRKRTKTFKLRRVTHNGGANQTITITVKLPKGALNALKHGARESVMLTLTASNGNGTRKTTLKIKRLRARKR